MSSILPLSLALLIAFPVPAFSQKRKPTRAPKNQTAPAAQQLKEDLREGATRVAEQLKLITRFIYTYGKVISSLEMAEEQDKRGESNQKIKTQTEQTKASLANNINGLRAGLESALSLFRGKPNLQPHYSKLFEASDAVRTAEQLASANRFDEAGKMLSVAAGHLVDLLVALR